MIEGRKVYAWKLEAGRIYRVLLNSCCPADVYHANRVDCQMLDNRCIYRAEGGARVDQGETRDRRRDRLVSLLEFRGQGLRQLHLDREDGAVL